MRPIAAFDTNILFSGVGWKGKPYECLELARAGKVEGVTCPEVLDTHPHSCTSLRKP
jgi:hypothetical protein